MIVHYPSGLKVTQSDDGMTAVAVEDFEYTDIYGYHIGWEKGEVVGYTLRGMLNDLNTEDGVAMHAGDNLYLRTELELVLGIEPEAMYSLAPGSTDPVM